MLVGHVKNDLELNSIKNSYKVTNNKPLKTWSNLSKKMTEIINQQKIEKQSLNMHLYLS